MALYRWFMPLLHLDVDVKLVQYVNLANLMTGMGSQVLRRPRMTLTGEERRRVEGILQAAPEARPNL